MHKKSTMLYYVWNYDALGVPTVQQLRISIAPRFRAIGTDPAQVTVVLQHVITVFESHAYRVANRSCSKTRGFAMSTLVSKNIRANVTSQKR